MPPSETVMSVMPVTEPPVMATALAFCVDIVPRPVMSVFGIVADAVNGLVPLPLTYPVMVETPVPPTATESGSVVGVPALAAAMNAILR